jgi:Peptidase S80 family
MSNSVKFACTALAGANKAGVLKRDANGYYEIVVGALNVFNSAGQLYVFEQAKALFAESSQLMRRVQRGALRGEYGHPKLAAGQTKESFANRVLSIYEENVCCHHKDITLDFDRVKDDNGRPIITIISKVLPAGPHGAVLQKSLDNPDENVCFSIRAFTDDFRDGGIIKRVLKTIVTWDYVNEPGISAAEKFRSPALEAMSDESFSRGELERALAQPAGMATESGLLTGGELFASMGWNVPKDVRPAWAGW